MAYGAGDAAGSLRHFRDHLAQQPADAAAWHAYGGALFAVDDASGAAGALERATALVPDNPAWLCDLGGLYLAVGQPAAAERSLRRAAQVPDASPEVSYNLAHALFAQDKIAEAAAVLADLVARHPQYTAAQFNLGIARKALGQWQAALTAFDATHRLEPEMVVAIIEAARCLYALGRPERASERYRAYLARMPEDGSAVREASEALYEQGEVQAAVELLRQRIERQPDDLEAANVLADFLHNLGDHDAARQVHEAVLRHRPDEVGAWTGLARLTRVRDPGDPLRMRLTTLLAQTDPASPAAAALHFALGKADDEIGDHAGAFAHYRLGNAYRRRQASYERRVLEDKVDRILATFDGATIQRLGALGDPSDLSVFVVGMPRSGTTLVEQVLASHPQVHGAGELRYFASLPARLPALIGSSAPYPECCRALEGSGLRAIAEPYLALLRRHAPRARRVIDKLPGNFLHLGLICGVFPYARMVHCLREPADVCLSIYFQHFRDQHDYAWDLDDIAHFYGQYRRVMAHWRGVCGARILDVHYEQMVERFEPTARGLVSHCGLEWDERCRDFHAIERDVRTASNVQVRQPLYRSSLRRWERYAECLPESVRVLNDEYRREHALQAGAELGEERRAPRD